MEINGRKIGPEHEPYFVADIGANHDGSLSRAMALIEQAAEAGADAVKFQSFQVETIVSRRGFADLGQIGHQAAWQQGVYETYDAAAMPWTWVPALAARCQQVGVAFMTTPYALELVDAIDPYVPAWKIGSGDITWDALIRHVASKGKPVLLATGAATASEVDDAIGYYFDGWPEPTEYGQHLVLMQCNTNYTGDPKNARFVNLRVLDDWRATYYAHLGFSDHTPGSIATCAAVAKGACVIEKHFTDDPARPGPDHGFAMTPGEWGRMVRNARATWLALGDGMKKPEANEAEARIVQRRALRWRYAISAGQVVDSVDVLPTRPCPDGALMPDRLAEVVGHRLIHDVEGDTLVALADLVPASVAAR
jgi:N-acetylneuraminate synthase